MGGRLTSESGPFRRDYSVLRQPRDKASSRPGTWSASETGMSEASAERHPSVAPRMFSSRSPSDASEQRPEDLSAGLRVEAHRAHRRARARSSCPNADSMRSIPRRAPPRRAATSRRPETAVPLSPAIPPACFGPGPQYWS